jgi:hypothetical protein
VNVTCYSGVTMNLETLSFLFLAAAACSAILVTFLPAPKPVRVRFERLK